MAQPRRKWKRKDHRRITAYVPNCWSLLQVYDLLVFSCVQADVGLSNGTVVTAAVPSGASTGKINYSLKIEAS